MSTANPMLDTATQRPATGMDEDARQLILNTLEGAPERSVLNGFLLDRYADLADYTRGVREVWGDSPADRMSNALARAANEVPTILSPGEAQRAEEHAANAVLLHMPEPDFRVAVSDTVRQQRLAASPVDRITNICRRRGIPWEFTASEGSAGWVTRRWRHPRCVPR
jgi:hypothetical protein